MNPFTNSEASIYIFALRYAMSRKTGAMMFVANEIAANWDRFSDRDRHEIKSEIIDADIHPYSVAKITALPK